MNEVVLDSSVLLAIVRQESYLVSTLDVLEGAVISTVNYAEVWTKLHELRMADSPEVSEVFSLLDRIEPFSISQAHLAADLRLSTRHAGLSLGDRLALRWGLK